MLTVRIPDDLRDAIDAVRGDVPRERWVRRACEAMIVQTNGYELSSSDPERLPLVSTRVLQPSTPVQTEEPQRQYARSCPDCGSLGAHQRGCKRG